MRSLDIANIMMDRRVWISGGALGAAALFASCAADNANENAGSPSPANTVSASAPVTPGATATPEGTPSVILPNADDQARADAAFNRVNPIVKKGCEYTAAADKAGKTKHESQTLPDPTEGDIEAVLVSAKAAEKDVVVSLFEASGSKNVQLAKCLGNLTVFRFGTAELRDTFAANPGKNRKALSKANEVTIATKGKFGENNFTEEGGLQILTRNPLKDPALAGTKEQVVFDNPKDYDPKNAEEIRDEQGNPLSPQKFADMYRVPPEMEESIEKSAAFVDQALS